MSRLYHISDLHFGAEDPDALAAFALRVRADPPDAIIVTGDLTYRARSREFDAARDWLAALGVPVSIAPGNHDLPYFNPWKRFARPYARFRALEAAICAPLTLGDVSIVALDTTARAQWRLNWSEGRVKPRRLAQAIADIGAAPDSIPVLVACHHPLVELDPDDPVHTAHGEEALAALAASGAAAVLSGHTHNPFDRLWAQGDHSIRLIGAGTLSERVREAPPGFNEIRIADGGIAVTPHSL